MRDIRHRREVAVIRDEVNLRRRRGKEGGDDSGSSNGTAISWCRATSRRARTRTLAQAGNAVNDDMTVVVGDAVPEDILHEDVTSVI